MNAKSAIIGLIAKKSPKVIILKKDDINKKAMADRSLWHVAQLVKDWKKKHKDDDAKCAILVRNRNYLGNVLFYLRKKSIPYQAIEIDKMNKRQVIIDLISLTRALCMENDTVAWLSLLRAPWCGLTLAQLEQFTPNENKSDNKTDNVEDATPADVQRTWAAQALSARPLGQCSAGHHPVGSRQGDCARFRR